MSYQVLARKWRPRSFSTLVGQEHVVRALTHALTEQRLHHAYLFTGTRGVGKTTLARILAKSLNCESGISATPCGQCSACQEIDAGRFVDLLEVDAATNTRVDEMRQLLENAVYAPTRGRFKVYVIDEVHMLSNSAFNAMLKTLEEPPEHVKFILATTDPQKIPVTVLSRCLQFNLKQMPPQAITGHLSHILGAESVPFEAPALALLARSANGSMRDALSLLDQAIAHGTGKVEESLVRDMLGTVDQDYLFTLLEAMAQGDVSAMLSVADLMTERSLSFDSALQDLAAMLTRLQVAQLAPAAIAEDTPDRSRLLALAGAIDAQTVQLAYQISVHGRHELPMAPDPHAGFVMTLLRLHAFAPRQPGEGPSPGKALAAPRAQAPAVKAAPSRISVPARAAEAPVVQPVATPAEMMPAAQVVAADSEAPGDWQSILDSLQLSGMARALAQHCELLKLGGEVVQLRLPPAHRHLIMKAAQDRLQQALGEYCGRPLQLQIEVAEVSTLTPAAILQQEREERQDRAVAAIEQDPFVREVIDIFDATLIESSIKPI
ncbi:DNA polymerase-3 subunit gamma/tau [Azospira oryzae]|uniref:DNA polymerase III subunit gamma/tau n=1 Tax=Azospira oryzae TaxID=146939 RepID=A0ABY0INR9_9RHOO|nr:DNA polymerase III subunit gamma/tau [Azospira oryzae]RZT89222.1 DNA polymerase-3 subunit gamma/tau [Azospira oryzae]